MTTCNPDANIVPIRMYRGTSKTWHFQAVKKSDGTGQDITGGRVVMSIKATLADAAALILKDSDLATIDILVGTDGYADIPFSPSDTAALAIKQYVYDVWVILASGKRYVAIHPSPFILEQAVSVIT